MMRRKWILPGAATIACGIFLLSAEVTSRATNQPSHDAKITLTSAPVGDDPQEKVTPTKRSKSVDKDDTVYNKLTPDEQYVILRKGTEPAFVGEYTSVKDPGTYICRRCNAPLYTSDTKFESHCGWPSFDDEIKGAVKHRRETDGTGRIEIVCENCSGHLGHVFKGEGFTPKNTRHCVNSLSMRFIPKGKELPEVILSPAAKAKLAREAKAAKPDAEEAQTIPAKTTEDKPTSKS